ncbi:hypothetical protein IW15_17315 [Chryseobacterium soli]|uniref:T9SS C-terminal target domain-containing protein n=1 Tax=Chryseobacterium soli TaxID=445961 RepID=A0A086A2L7_9FLAO|nr:hypothetical protein [Chryseobacterium soli]KFF10931.1 hypothetical protein IW15_17315 [Chryseobacterium soli]
MKKLFLVVAVIISQTAFSQQADFLKIKKYRINYLNDRMHESSGLNILNGNLYTFNDSGNAPELFEINKTSGEIINVLKIEAQNTDWEALTNDGTYFYIGDFGNNDGSRKHLKIFKVPVQNNGPVQTLPFYYPDQNDFSSRYYRMDLDAEAMVYTNKKLHIFSKEWVSKKVTHYIIDPEITENQKAEKVESYTTNYLVTDAAYFDGKLYLVGYTKKTEVFLDVFKEKEPGIFFKEKPKHYYLGTALAIGQIEGIAVDESGIYISGEKFKSPLGSAKPSLYFIPKERFKD